jgi:acyl carrier protein
MSARVLTAAALALLLAAAPPRALAQEEPGKQGEPVTATEVLQKVRRQVALQLGIEAKQVAPGRPLREYGADQLDIVELVMALEQEFDIEIPDDVGSDPGPRGWEQTVTAQRFADIVMEQLRRKR